MNDRNDLTVSDQLSFWADHLPDMQGIGIQLPRKPAPAPVPESGPDIGAMSMSDFAAYRADHGLDTGDFIGVKPWSRTNVAERQN